MQLTIFPILVLSAWVVTAQVLNGDSAQSVITELVEDQKYLIRFPTGDIKWVTEADKWRLREVNHVFSQIATICLTIVQDGWIFMDITDFQEFGKIMPKTTKKDKFPKKALHQSKVKPLLNSLTASNIKSHLEFFTSFQNRFYISDYGAASSRWLFALIKDTIHQSGADKYGTNAKLFYHRWDQPSIIVTIPGKSNSTVVVGAHQDSLNYTNPIWARAPGADDDGSGTMAILETLRVLLKSKDIIEGNAENTVEFHWYAAEEAGLLGSQHIFSTYEKAGRDVKAMLQQDMTGFVELTIEAGRKPQFGLMLDFYEKELMDYMKIIIEEYTEISWIETACGCCGSDHMSALWAGYPAVYIVEAEFKLCDNHLHGSEDLLKYLDYNHMVDHAQMTLGFVYELAFAKL